MELCVSSIHRAPEATQEASLCKDPKKAFGLYIHIPYCKTKCPYCDFYTHPTQSRSDIEEYVNALCTEITLSEEYGWRQGSPVDTIFLGGGTPSLLKRSSLEKILSTIRKQFSVKNRSEITIEINPETVNSENSFEWRLLGINRASLGVQSLQDHELLRLKRGHNSEGSRKAYFTLRDSGFENINIDLMYGLEGQTTQLWISSLLMAIDWQPQHISSYNLTIEEKTPFGSQYRLGQLKLPNEETQISLFRETHDILESKGYSRYEISNFARPCYEAKHNLIYWTGGVYWGVGVSAHSFKPGVLCFERWWNLRNLPAYILALKQGRLPPHEHETLPPETHWEERLMTGLRLKVGVNIRDIEGDIGTKISPELRRRLMSFVSSGYMERKNERFSLTEKGILISNEIFRELISS